MTTKSIRFSVCFALALGLGAPALTYAWTPVVNNSEQPGSVLVFPKFRTGTVNTIEGEPGGTGIRPRTEFEISVVCAKGSEGTTCADLPGYPVVNLMAHWVCEGGDDPDEPEDLNRCRERDFTIQTTVNGTVYFSPEGTRLLGPRETLVPTPPCDEGYLIVWVVDQFGKAIAYNGLIGDAILKTQGSFVIVLPTATAPLATASAYNAIPIQANDNLRISDFTDRDGDGALDFGLTDSGYEYLPVTGRIIGTVRYPGPSGAFFGRIETELTLLTLDVLSNRVNTPTDVDFVFYNEAECPISESLSFVCWESEELNDREFGGDNLTSTFGRKGLVESGTAQQAGRDVTLLGLIETREIDVDAGLQRDYAYSLFNDGVPVNTAFDPGNAPTMPPPAQPPLSCEQPGDGFLEVMSLSSRTTAPPVLDPPVLPPPPVVPPLPKLP